MRLSSAGSGEGSVFNLIQVVGQIHFLGVFGCWMKVPVFLLAVGQRLLSVPWPPAFLPRLSCGLLQLHSSNAMSSPYTSHLYDSHFCLHRCVSLLSHLKGEEVILEILPTTLRHLFFHFMEKLQKLRDITQKMTPPENKKTK